jgi:hypothetical protein
MLRPHTPSPDTGATFDPKSLGVSMFYSGSLPTSNRTRPIYVPFCTICEVAMDHGHHGPLGRFAPASSPLLGSWQPAKEGCWRERMHQTSIPSDEAML